VALAATILRLTQAIVLAANLLGGRDGAAARGALRRGFGAGNLAGAVQAVLELQRQGHDLGPVFFGINCLQTASRDLTTVLDATAVTFV